MIAGAGFLGRPLTGVLLFVTLGGIWNAPRAQALEVGPDTNTLAAFSLEAPPVQLLPAGYLQREFFPPYLPVLHLNLAYTYPLTAELTYGPRNLGATGRLDLPEGRRLKAGLEFSLILHGEVRRLAPDASGATLTVGVHPGWISEDWLWPDGLTLQRIYFQPANAEALGVRCVLTNKTTHTYSGVRLAVQLSNPDMTSKNARVQTRAGFSDLMSDPRNEILVLKDLQSYEEGFMAFGWGPQGGFMGSGGYEDDFPPSEEKKHTRHPADVAVSLETPAWDVFPQQRREAFFWITWGLETESVQQTLEMQRLKPGYKEWEKKAYAAAAEGVSFECHDPQAAYLFSSVKAWSVWMKRSDELGNQYLYSPRDTEPVRPAALASGAWGYAALGKTGVLKAHLENWLAQNYEPADTACLVAAMHAYFLWTHDRPWLEENSLRLEDMLNALADMDINGDGLPEQARNQAVSVAAFRQGAELFKIMGHQHLVTAAKFQALAAIGEQTLKTTLSHSKSRITQTGHDSGQGREDLVKNLEMLRISLLDPSQATAAAEAWLNWARRRVSDQSNLGGMSSQAGQGVSADFESLKLIELVLQGLAGLDFSLEGLRVHVPPYKQDLGVRLNKLSYAGALLQVEVKGSGTHGRIFVNKQAWNSSRLIPQSFFAKGKVQIVIEKEP